jgi:DNA-binding PadR family transcriptional regulator
MNDISYHDILETNRMKVAKPEDFQPLSETTLYILVSLAPAPLHGYAIAKKVRDLSEEQVVLSVSTLYTTLKRLLEDGWIERVGEEPEPDEAGRPRKTYALTERGQRILAAEKTRLRSLLAIVQKQTVGKGI